MQARDRLVVNYIPLVRRLSNRYRGAIEPPEDLFQVGMIGLLNTIEKFDPSYGTSFSSLAIPEIRGAILNHLRDHGSLIKIPRALKQKKLAVDKVAEALAPRIGRWPTVGELAQACDLAEEDVNAAMNLGRTGDPRSLDEDLGNDDGEGCATLSDLVGGDDDQFDMCLVRMTLEAGLDSLPVRKKTIITLRFNQGLSQRQTAEHVGMSQMHVSRLERSALLELRVYMQRDAVTPFAYTRKPEASGPQASAA